MSPDAQIYLIQEHAQNAFYELDKCSAIIGEMLNTGQVDWNTGCFIDKKACTASAVATDLIAYLRNLPVPFSPKEEQDADQPK